MWTSLTVPSMVLQLHWSEQSPILYVVCSLHVAGCDLCGPELLEEDSLSL